MKIANGITVALGIVMLCLLPILGKGQQPKVDSMAQVLKTYPKQDSQLVLLLLDYAWELRRTGADDPLESIKLALQLSRRLDFQRGVADASVQMGLYHQNKYHLDVAESLYMRAIQIREDLHDIKGLASVYNNLGKLNGAKGDVLQSRSYFLKAVTTARLGGDSNMEAIASNQLCDLYATLGDFKRSVQFGLWGLHLREQANPLDSGEIGKVHLNLGATFEKMGEADRAKSQYLSAKKCFEASFLPRELGSVLQNLGTLEEMAGNLNEAQMYYRQCYEMRMSSRDTMNAVIVLRNLAHVQRYLGEFTESRELLNRALAFLVGTGDRKRITLIRADLAELLLWEGEPEQALALLQPLLPIIDSLADPTVRIYFDDVMSMACYGAEKWTLALSYNFLSLRLRHSLDHAVNAGVYQYDKYLETSNEAKLLKKDIVIEEERSKQLKIIIFGLVLLLILLVFASLQRIRHLQQKRKTVESQLQLEMKDLEMQQREQSKRMELLQVSLDVEDRERSRIAHDLHDRVGAQLGAFKHLFGQLRDDLAKSTPATEQSFLKLNAELETLMVEVRAVSHDLESPTLKQFGLVAAIKGFRELFAKVPGLDFELDVHGLEKRLNPKAEKHIYLILKELCANALRHGKATAFSIQLFQADQVLTIVVEDNGNGFDPKNPQNGIGLGLQSINNRVQTLEGTIVIDSVVGRGTIITIEIPIPTITQ